ncbi:MAG: MFS transporter [Alphaproteobacteria bacterium]
MTETAAPVRRIGRFPVALFPVLGGRFFTHLAFGPLQTLLIIRLTETGFSVQMAAWVRSLSTAGLILGSFFCFRLINRLGHARAYAIFAWTVGVGAILYAVLPPPWTWFAIALGVGSASFGITVTVESWLQALSTNDIRGRVMSLYMVIGGLAGSVGMVAIDLFDSTTIWPFVFFASLIAISPIPVLRARAMAPKVERPRAMPLRDLIRVSPLGVAGTMISGVIGGAQFGLAAVFALQQENLIVGAGSFVAAMMVGQFLAQYPVGGLSDLFDRRKVLLGIYLCAGLAALGLVAANAWIGGVSVLVMMAVLGGATGVAYPQATAYVNDHLDDDQRVSANSGLMLAFSIGAFTGPLPAAYVMDWIGPEGLYYYVAAMAFAAASFTLYRMSRRPSPQSQVFDPAAARVTPSLNAIPPTVVRRAGGDADGGGPG